MVLFKKYDTTLIIDMLVKHTDEYSKMLVEGSSPKIKFADCKKTIALLQEEINLRKSSK